MTPEKEAITDLTTLIPWAIERILRFEYVLETDAKGRPASLELDPGHGAISTEQMVEDLKSLSAELRQLIDTLERDYSAENLQRILPQILPPAFAKQIAEHYAHNSNWNHVIHDIYWALRSGIDFAEVLTNERIGLGSKVAEKSMGKLEGARPGISVFCAAEKYANELITLYPRIVKRARSLRILQTGRTASKEMKTYLAEASRCFIFGNFLASLFVCRSAIETAVECCLRDEGYGSDVDRIEKDKLKTLLTLASTKKVLNEAYFKKADYVRDIANKAIHKEKLPEEKICRSAYDMTRSVIEYLYA